MAKKKMWFVTALACVGIALGGGALGRQLANEKTKELPTYSYTIGIVDEDGEIDKGEKTSIVSDELKVKDLVSIEIAEDAEVQVFIHWYNEDGDWMSKVQVTDGTPVAIEGAETFRVEIVPTEDEDGEVGVFEKGTYAKLVTVTLKK